MEEEIEMQELVSSPIRSPQPKNQFEKINFYFQKYGAIGAAISCFLFFIAFITTQSILIEHQSAMRNMIKDSTYSNECSIPLEFYPFNTSQIPQSNNEEAILLRNLILMDGIHAAQPGQDILISQGKIVRVGPNLSSSLNDFPQVLIHEMGGRFVTPGLIDMHSHMTIDPLPWDAIANDDSNEMSDPVTPFVKVIDAMNFNDFALPLVRKGGVLVQLVMPGSGNVMGGEGFLIKLKKSTNQFSSLILRDAPKRYFKMATGENPKGDWRMPMTRMGSGYLMRDAFYKAAELRRSQQEWDCLKKSGYATETPRPQDLTLDPLVSILDGSGSLQVHSYKVEDMEMMIRLMKEFNFSISTFHHAHEAYKIADKLAANHIGAAIFSELSLYKVEAYDVSLQSPNIFQQAGVDFAFVSDHPVTHSRKLIEQARAALNYNPSMTKEQILAAVTSTPAKLLGLAERVGSILPGRDADLLAWNADPFEIGALPEFIMIDGEIMEDLEVERPNLPNPAKLSQSVPLKCSPGIQTLDQYLFKNVTVLTMDDSNLILKNAWVAVKNGVILCVSDNCSQFDLSNFFSVEGNGTLVIPGLVSLDSTLSQMEIDRELASMDGYLDGISPLDASQIRALDGIQFNMFQRKKLQTLFSSGILVQLASGLGNNLVKGLGAAHFTSGLDVDDAIVKKETSLHITIGSTARSGGLTSATSGQFTLLRQIFRDNQASYPFDQIFNGSLPVFFHVHQADQIVSVVRFVEELNIPKMVIVGGAEAHHALRALGSSKKVMGVVLSPFQSMPEWFEKANANDESLLDLLQANLTVALADPEPTLVRLLRWKAGIAFAQLGVPYLQAISLVTKNPAKLLGLYDQGIGQIKVNTTANFVVFSNDPLSFKSQISFLAFKNQLFCKP